jgi:hypothetical protein
MLSPDTLRSTLIRNNISLFHLTDSLLIDEKGVNSDIQF